MRNKLRTALTIIFSCALTCILTIRVVTGQNPFTVLAEGGNNWVYSVNNVSAGANGNVNVSTVNGNTVSSNVPADANFTQYSQTTADIITIETKLDGLTATADQVANGLTFVGSGGTVETGTLSVSTGSNIVSVGGGQRGGNGDTSITLDRDYLALFCYIYSTGRANSAGFPYPSVNCNGGTGVTNITPNGGYDSTHNYANWRRITYPGWGDYFATSFAVGVYKNVPKGSVVTVSNSMSNTGYNRDTSYAIYGVVAE